jgi:antitoxin (DNA-binding transcriptional repressor) of toxin-antitoxin stability system
MRWELLWLRLLQIRTRLSLVMVITNIHEAKTHFSKLIERVEAGEEIIIGRSGKPVAILVRFPRPKNPPKREPGGWEGQVWMSPDFDAVDKEIEALFCEGEIEPTA